MIFRRFTRRRILKTSLALAAVCALPANLALADEIVPGMRAQVAGTGGAGLRLRTAPGYGGRIVDLLPENESFSVVEGPVASDGISWVRVDSHAGSGWVSRDFLAAAPAPNPGPAPAPAPAAGQSGVATPERASASSRGGRAADTGTSIATLVQRYVGARYVFGGSSPAGFDCSGLVWYVLRQHGIDIGRSTWSQIQHGRRVALDSLEPGDIVFFENTYIAGLSHVGIYVGGGRFVDAGTERTGVRFSSMWNPYWAARFYGARRVH